MGTCSEKRPREGHSKKAAYQAKESSGHRPADTVGSQLQCPEPWESKYHPVVALSVAVLLTNTKPSVDGN